ncbi:MraY family glycosyltransferase [Actinoallomurus bryophytorum]|uniref:UDP-GlcNAc:undecaprenyl-phosphate GlcNAc-1-phosphate transferase n=1 Tax=Actinoallomurus bryophytorum TaxID=1490222 RepID=A0A543CNG3_9ACTN|nr:MraY family glycosyltransferase [Actinoallomurus bryophytorum]TQL98648.1 UDP-GlcNAc:undecaprenyl-phosphate GlcNAc-1-phosphate transferase [Actinoallomurus bryophytorum]
MREYILTFLTGAIVTYLLVPLVLKFAIWFKAMTPVRDRDVHAIPTPRLGGLAMFFGMLAALLMASRLPHLHKVFTESPTWIGLLSAGGLLVVVGIADDRWEIDALTKMAGQVAAAGLLIMNGVQLLWIPLPGGTLVLPPSYGVPLTIVLVVATINAVNFIDGLDGLAAGIVGVSALAFFLYAFLVTVVVHLDHQSAPALIAAVLAGMCVGFLPHNFSPARIFMGDTGSMLIGLLLATSMITVSGFDPVALRGSINRFPTILPLIPLAILVVPYADMLMAVIRRSYDLRSPFAPDKKHLHHRLLDMGHSHRGAALVMYLWTGLFSFGVVALSAVKSPLVVLSVASLVAIAALVVMAFPQLRPHGRRHRTAERSADERPRQPA